MYDGLAGPAMSTCHTEADDHRASKDALLAAVAADLADVERFRAERPNAAESIAAELTEYVRALELLAGAYARSDGSDEDSRWETWQRIVTRSKWRGAAG